MQQPQSLKSKCIRSAIVSAAALTVTLAGCAEQQATGPNVAPAAPEIPRIARANNVTFSEFLNAWSQSFSAAPIQTQMFALDDRQDRQYVDWYPNEAVLSFARAYPGHLYIHGDEPDQWCMDPVEYAGMYKNFVSQIRGADPTARVSPAGFAEPNDRCCEPGDETCRQGNHSVGYAQKFYDAYVVRYGQPPAVDEWRFHDFGVSFRSGDLDGWWSRIDRAAAWSVAHGANMVLGGWGFHGWRDPVPSFQEYLKQAIGRLMADNRINGAVYWSYEPWIESPRPLVNSDGSLTAEGQTYANPLTDIPTGVKLVGSADGRARLRWNNTTSAWAAEAEYWVRPAGSLSFAYHSTQRVAALGASQTPFGTFKVGDVVRARVRYYNVFGEAGWSPFSNAVRLALNEPNGGQRPGSGKSPILCLLRLC